MPAAPSHTYCTAADVEMLLSEDGTTGRLDDDESGTRNSAESAFLTQAIYWATARCNLYLSAYPAPDLANSWLVNQWCAILAAHTVSVRRGNPAAGSLEQLREEALEDLKMVRAGSYQLPDVAPRTGAWPKWSNVTVSVLHHIRKVRVERPISESRDGGVDYPQIIDRKSEVIAPYEQY